MSHEASIDAAIGGAMTLARDAQAATAALHIVSTLGKATGNDCAMSDPRGCWSAYLAASAPSCRLPDARATHDLRRCDVRAHRDACRHRKFMPRMFIARTRSEHELRAKVPRARPQGKNGSCSGG